MSSKKTGVAALALALALGCSADDRGGAATEGSESGGDGPASTGGATADTGGASAGSSGASVDTGGASEDTGGQSCEDEGEFGGPQLRDCDLPGACGSCMWEKACASFLFRCAHVADCVCAAECVAQSGVNTWESCLGQCGLNEIPPGFAEWLKGASDMCYDEGCGVLEDPPVDPSAPPDGNAGAGTDPDCAFDPGLSYDPCGDVLQLQSADGSLCARVERRNDGPGNDANTNWTLLDVRVGPLTQVCHTDAAEDLCWFNSHHNYADWLHVSCGGLHYDLNIGQGCGEEFNPQSNFRLHVFENEPGGAECSPSADGTCPVVTAMDLFPVP